ncbi:DUF4442 domain-containing protein [Mucilaginibacter sp. MD40]|uniref:DUF4442 domain-containing protein n=1 Tax=Mucilaginibacter sp. MD40 TaxID=2029590 RepID=UPI000BACE6F2|nr:DUF4442 domain-containing protein [Mucilaginibacter sp. MD40]PAW94091.1 DUF4442 domain-containing protein [Mucilaginibacter sp. MD40]
MVVSENTLKWIMRFYPPLFFQRVWVKGFNKDFRGVHVSIIKSFLNTNYNGSIFGGTIFAAADPFYPVLFDRILQSPGRKLKIWSKSSTINYLIPATGNLKFTITITEHQIQEVIDTIDVYGKYEGTYPVEIFNDNNEICASLNNEVYIRDLNFKPL